MLKRIVTLLHRWIGLPLGVLFLVTLVTGLVVGGADLLRALDGKGQTYRETSIEEDARALDRMVQDVPRIFQAVLPTPYTPYNRGPGRGAKPPGSTASAISSRSTTGSRSVVSIGSRWACIGRFCWAGRVERSASAAPAPSRGSG